MTPEQLTAFNLVLLAAIASPGAAFLVAARSTVTGGRAAGLATGLGLATMASAWTLAALLGLETVFALFPWAYSGLKIGGALYLIYLAIKTWRGARSPLGTAPKPHGRAYMEGLMVNLANPKSVLFAAAVIVVVFPGALNLPEIALITANHFILEVICYSLFALVLSAAPARARYLAAKPTLDRIASVLLGGFGLKLLLQR